MREIKFKYVIKADDRIKISKSYTLEEIDDIACMFETVVEDFNNYCTDIGHTSTTCDCFEDFWDKGEIVERIQFTGLKDKNGIEIYEGDILKVVSNGYSKYISFNNKNCIVEFCNETFSFIGKNDEGMFHLNSKATIEVIGNIYENPELLK